MLKNQLSDQELWTAIVMDDSRAFAALYDRYWKKLYKTTNYYLKDATASEQILQDVFVVLWNRRKFLKIENFNNYVYVTARYHVFKYLKAAKLSPIEYIENYDQEHSLISTNSGEEKLSYSDFENKLAKCLLGLPKRCREIFWMSRVDNLSNDEIAIGLGISKRTVENQITQASKHLKVSYAELTASAISMMFITLFKILE